MNYCLFLINNRTLHQLFSFASSGIVKWVRTLKTAFHLTIEIYGYDTNLKFYKNIARGVILANHITYLQNLKKLPLKIITGNLVIHPANKNNMTVMKNLPLLEKKKRRRRSSSSSRRNTKLKMMIMIALIEELLKKKIVQMRLTVKLKTFKKLLLHLQKDN